jgi:Ni,Fe-hydrogenase III large subunit
MAMPTLSEVMGQGRPVRDHRPWPRAVVPRAVWISTAERLNDGSWTLLGLWGERDAVHMAVLDESRREVAVLSLEGLAGRFPSVGQFHPPAIRLERAIKDLFGLEPEGTPDSRRWLDHGRWGLRAPLGLKAAAGAGGDAYPFLAAEGESLHQIPVGPVHAGIIEPGHFRFTAGGETVVRLEERLGYVHKGIESLMAGADPARAARLAGRTSGDSTVACALAFARAVEGAAEIAVPARAVYLRALMAELERLANHFGDIGAVCNDAAFALMHAHCGVLREEVLRAADACFGHRLMMDRVVPGGVAVDLAPEDTARLHGLVRAIRARFPELVELYDNTASLKDRTVGTGILAPALARQFGCGGYVGRASGRAFDARKALGYAPYDALDFETPHLEAGDVNARVWVRVVEVKQSLALVEQILDRLPGGPVRAADDAWRPDRSGEGLALVEGFRGDVLVWLRIGGGLIERCHVRDPSWFQWPLLEAAIEGNIVADFPLCNKSFNCSYSGHDL